MDTFEPIDAAAMEPRLPLPWAVYDRHGTILLAQGEVLASEEERDWICREWQPHRRKPALSVDHEDATTEEELPAPPRLDSAIPRELVLRPGDALTIQPPSATGFNSANASVIGTSPGGLLFITMPRSGGEQVRCRPGELLAIKAFSGQVVFSFACTVESASFHPIGYLILTPPAQIRKMQLRKSTRVRCKLPARMVRQDQDPAGCFAVIQDLSATGASICVHETESQEGEPVVLRFRLIASGIEFSLAVRATVRTLKPLTSTSAGGGLRLGLEFGDADNDQQVAIGCYVYEQLVTSYRRLA